MRNLKKVLALALAVVMLFGMMVVGAGAVTAEYPDAADVTYVEAMDVMSEIGIFEGDGEGNLNPEGILTREQAAKIIAGLMLGTENAKKLGKGTQIFSDVEAEHWSAGFITYCANLGIICGSNGKFNPTGELTGTAFAKMLLVALGYDAEIEGYANNSNWATNINSDAITVGLDIDGVDLNKALTREQAAQMALNAIKTPLVKYATKGSNISVNGAEINFGASEAEYVTTTLAKEGTRISDTTLTNSNGVYTIEFGEKYLTGLWLSNNERDAYGRPAHTWAFQTETIGQYTDVDLMVKEYTAGVTYGTLYNLLGKNVLNNYDLASYVDGNTGAVDIDDIAWGSYVDVPHTGNGVLTQVFVDHAEEEITVVSINTYLAIAGADYNATLKTAPITVFFGATNATTYSARSFTESSLNFPVIAELTTGTPVKVNVVYPGTAWETVTSVEAVEVVPNTVISSYALGTKGTGTATYYNLNTFVANGEKYTTGEKACYDAALMWNYNQTLDQLSGSTYDLFIDDYGYVLGLEEVVTFDPVIFVVGYDTGSNVLAQATDKALVITTEGKMMTVNAKEDVGVTSLGDDPSVNTWYDYSIDADGTYVLKRVSGNQDSLKSYKAASGVDISGLYADLVGANAVAYGNANSVYITVDADTSVANTTPAGSIVNVNGVITGIKKANIEADDVSGMDGFANAHDTFFLYNDAGYVTYAVVVGEDFTTSNNTIFFTNRATGRYYDAAIRDYYVTYTVIMGGELKTVKVMDACASAVNPGAGQLFRATINAAGYITGLSDGTTPGTAYANSATMNSSDNKVGYTQTAGTSPNGVALTLRGATLWVTATQANNNYVVIGENCKVFLKSYNKSGYVEHPSVESAIGALVNDTTKGYVSQVTTVCDNQTGYANTLIITETKVGAAPATDSTVTALDVKTGVTAVDVAATPVAVGGSSIAGATAGSITVDTSATTGTNGSITVDKLLSVLVPTGTKGTYDDMYVILTDWTGADVPVKGDDTVKTNMQVVYEAVAGSTTTYFVYTITVS